MITQLRGLIHRSNVPTGREVAEIQATYRSLDRSRIAADELVLLKFQMQQWREQSMGRLLDQPASEDQIAALELLEIAPSEVSLRLLADQVSKSASAALKRRAAEYFAHLGEHDCLARVGYSTDERLTRLAGPRPRLPIIANAPSFRWPMKRWSRNPEFSRYQFEGSGVRYRGLVFQPGDVLASSVNLDGNGVYTVLSEPRGIAYHLGAFAILTLEGRPTPVVIESYKLGVRAVPLSTFVSREFNSFVDVYRLKSTQPGFHDRINAAAVQVLAKTKRYNFDTEDSDRESLACTMVPSHLFELAGEAKIATKSDYSKHPTVMRNLEYFELIVPAFLAATDYVMDARMECVGAIDNGQFVRNVTREICELAFLEMFKGGVVDPGKLPLMYHLNCFGIRQMRAGGMLGSLIGMPYGFTKENFCKGPTPTMAIIEIYEHMLAKAVRRSEAVVRGAIEFPIDIKKLARDPRVVATTTRALAPIAVAYGGEGSFAAVQQP